MTPRKIGADDEGLPALLALIQSAFAGMDGRIDPPSSMNRLTLTDVAQQTVTGEVWAIGTPPVACVFFTPKPGELYVGKLATAATHRGQGLARRLITQAEATARARGLPRLALETRVELTENHTAFAAMGFAEVGRTAHAGFDRPTSITMHKAVAL